MHYKHSTSLNTANYDNDKLTEDDNDKMTEDDDDMMTETSRTAED